MVEGRCRVVEMVLAFVAVYTLVHVALLLAVLMPLMRRNARRFGTAAFVVVIVTASLRRLFSTSSEVSAIFSSSSEERVSTMPDSQLPPGAIVPEMIAPEPPPLIERRSIQRRDDDIMTELRDLLDGWSTTGDGANADDGDGGRMLDANASALDVALSEEESEESSEGQRERTLRQKLPAVIEPYLSDEASTSTTDSTDYETFKYWARPEPVLDEESAEKSAAGQSEDEQLLNSFMERRFDSPSTTTPVNTPMTATGKPPPSQPIAIHKRTSPLTDSNSETSSLLSQTSSERHFLPPPQEFDYQDIIPQPLLDNFISMVEPSRAQLIETDISRHCAHNFPAVAFTLGRKHWPQLKGTYVALSNDMQVD